MVSSVWGYFTAAFALVGGLIGGGSAWGLLKGRVSAMDGDITQIDRRIHDLEVVVGGKADRSDLRDLRQDMAEGFQHVNSRLDQIVGLIGGRRAGE